MAELVRVPNLHVGYFDVLDTLIAKGRHQDSRNGKTIEVEDLVIEVENISLAAPNGVRPGYNFPIAVVEGLQLIAGVSDPSLTCQIQPNFQNYLEPDGTFWGGYGPRLKNQLPIIVERLRSDPDTRQAVLTLWDPTKDDQPGKRDYPCTNRFSFRVRDGKLNMTVDMRSLDLWWGLPYDSVQFGMLHTAVAASLRLPLGRYTHRADSAHLYEPHWETAMSALRERAVTELPLATPMLGSTNAHWDETAELARRTLRVAAQTAKPESIQDYPHHYQLARVLLQRRKRVLDKLVEKL